jgi:hypothetical protein
VANLRSQSIAGQGRNGSRREGAPRAPSPSADSFVKKSQLSSVIVDLPRMLRYVRSPPRIHRAPSRGNAMTRISPYLSSPSESSLPERAATSNLGVRAFRLSPVLPRVFLGVTAAAASIAAAFCILGPFSDLSALQLAAGPHSVALGPGARPIVEARTGRSWGADQQRRVAAESSRPLATLARGPSQDAPSIGRTSK